MKIRVIVISMIMVMLCVMLIASCSAKGEPEPAPAPAPEPGSGSESVIGNIPEGSILLFQNDEGAAKLIADMEEGRTPLECHAMYDAMGSRPEVGITDPEIISEVYNRLGHLIIGGETNESITDCYHYVYFTLQDGTEVGWSFEGTGILCRGSANYKVTNSGSLWSMVQQMQDEMMGEQ